MSKQAILEIKRAEEQAELTRRAAREKAEAMKVSVKAEGKAHCEEVVRVTKEEYGARLDEIRAKAAALIARKRAEAEQEAEALCAAAEEHMAEAVDAIVWGIVEKCQ